MISYVHFSQTPVFRLGWLTEAIYYAKRDGYNFYNLNDDKKLYYAELANIQNWDGYKRAQHLIDIYPSVVAKYKKEHPND